MFVCQAKPVTFHDISNNSQLLCCVFLEKLVIFEMTEGNIAYFNFEASLSEDSDSWHEVILYGCTIPIIVVIASG